MAQTQSEGLLVTEKVIEDYLIHIKQRGRSEGTIQNYKRKLRQLYAMLPEDKMVRWDTLSELRKTLQEQGGSNAAINIFIAAANGLVEYCGRRELQLKDALEHNNHIAPELTRAEYLCLLSAAKALDRERTYLLIKTIVNTGLYVREVELVTVEAVQSGRVAVPGRGIVPLSPCLCDELMAYCNRRGTSRGPVFTTEEGKPMHRSTIAIDIKRLAADAHVQEEKCTLMALRRLYLATQENILAGLAVIVEERHDRIFEEEQLTIGWGV